MAEIHLTQVDYPLSLDGYGVTTKELTPKDGLQPVEYIDYEIWAEKVAEGNETYEVIKGPSGRKYEIAIYNADQLSTAQVYIPSTSFSSLYKNPGNAIQTPLSAIVNPNAAHIYIGSLGNHPTGHMSMAELRYISRTGRYTTGNGINTPYKPLGSVVDMAEALHNRGLSPTHFSADIEAGRLALALMSASEPNTVQAAYLNGLDGISPPASYAKSKLGEDLASRTRRRQIQHGYTGEITPDSIKDVKQRMPKIYHGLGRIAHLAPLPVLLYPRDALDKLFVTNGFRRHSDTTDLQNHAVYNDIRAALAKQNATITLQFNKESAIHNIDECIALGKIVMNSLLEDIPPPEQKRVRLLIGEGTLDQHTDTPYYRLAAEKYALQI